ncbi:hypothetical protein niasHT_021670 [Heterodera trifolii]|uniref:Uncharacterized protein n=1 Tax=Heterodera trifolii TaxID=157864 RepID=A0ABD2JSP1_9BILA
MMQDICVLGERGQNVRSIGRAESSASWRSVGRAFPPPPLGHPFLLLYNFLGSFVVRPCVDGCTVRSTTHRIASAGRPILRPSARARRSLLLCAVCVWRGVAAVCLMGENAGGGGGREKQTNDDDDGRVGGWRREGGISEELGVRRSDKIWDKREPGGTGGGPDGWLKLITQPLAQQQHREFGDQIFDREKIWGGPRGTSRTGINGTEGKWLIKVQEVGQRKGGDQMDTKGKLWNDQTLRRELD